MDKRLIGKRVLVVDDDSDLLDRLGPILEQAGTKYICMHTCIETALSELIKNGRKYDISVVDIRLPNTISDLEKYKYANTKIKEIRRTLSLGQISPNSTSVQQKDLEIAYDRRLLLLDEMRSLINPLGGIELIRKWKETFDSSKYTPPIF